VRLMAGEAGIHGGCVRVLQGQPFSDALMAGKAQFLRGLEQKVLAPAVVGRVAGQALASAGKLVSWAFPCPRGEGLVADLAQPAPTETVKEIRIGGAVLLVAPLAMPIPQGFVRRGSGRGREGRSMAGGTLVFGVRKG